MNTMAKCVHQLNLKMYSKVIISPKRASTNAQWPFVDIPSVGSSMLASIWNGGPKKLHNYIDRLHSKHGPAFYKISPEGFKVLFVSDPDLNLEVYRCEGRYPVHVVPESWKLCLEELGLKRGLFFMDDIEWKQNRSIMNGLMGRLDTVEKLTPLINMTATRLVNAWSRQLPTGKTLERDLHKWSAESVALSFVGANIHADIVNGKCSTISDEFLDSAYTIFKQSSFFFSFSPLLAQKCNMPSWKKLRSSIETTLTLGKEIVQTGIEEHDRNVQHHPCIMAEMMKENFTDDMIYRIIVDMIMTASDTSSITALWTLYVLGKHPEVADKCYEEISAALGDKKTIDLSDLKKMPYLSVVCKEAIRLYPVAPFVTRLANCDITYKQYYVPKHTMVAMSLFTMFRDGNVYHDPNSYIPERWLREDDKYTKEDRANMSRSFIPFGMGARSCIAKHLAKVNTEILIAHLLLNFKWQVTNDVKPVLRMITVPNNNLKVNISKRISGEKVLGIERAGI